MKYSFFCLLTLLISCQTTDLDAPRTTKSSISFAAITDSLQLLAPGLISNGSNQRDFALSPAEDEIFYTLVSPKNQFSAIIQLKKEGEAWSKPEVAPFSGKYSDLEPAYTPDGSKLFFASTRPLSNEGAPKDFDIWYVEKVDGAWSGPQNVGPPVNTEKDEYYPSVSSNGNLYFTAAYENAIGREDIYKSKWKKGQYQSPEPLDSMINSVFYEFNAYISPDENLIIFSSYGRADGFGGGDLYLAQKDDNDQWEPASNLGSKINSDKLDYCPFVDLGQNVFYFTSERNSIKKHYPGGIDFQKLTTKMNQAGNGLGSIYFTDFKTLKVK